ncbi:MAG: hypothetical protein FWF44_04615, partial [Defluviitaleaceae bacterium]|nr:hypothetical protein [Defluviitaleaceae bacterium]
MKKHFFIRLISLLMISVLLLPVPTAAAAEAAPDGRAFFRSVSNMLSDPDTSRLTDHLHASTIENGRIWTDKTVNTDTITFYDAEGNPVNTINSAPDEFLVTLSALSQSYSIETVVEPTDTVFILDVSASMDVYQLGGVSRATVMVQALNDAIHTVMDANPENRVAVVAYGGYASGGVNMSRSQRILRLGHYDVAGDYLSITGNRITVNPAIPAGMVGVSPVIVEGGTPTQRGIYEGASMLWQNADTNYTYTTEKGRVITATRRPVMVLLTDGEPTFGWRDYRLDGGTTDGGYDCANGNPASIDLGTDILTVLTASYWKQRVRDHYYGTADTEMQFYTIGVGVSGTHAPAVMDPYRNAAANIGTVGGVTYNMKTMLDGFVDPAVGSATFPVLNRGSGTLRSMTTAVNTDGYIKSYAYTDGYFPTENRQALDDAFRSIARYIVSAGHYVTEIEPTRPDFSGFVTFADPIGEHMQFRELKGARIEGQTYVGMRLAKSITEEPEGGPLWEYWSEVLSARMGIGKAAAAEIIASNIAGGAMYYNSDEDFKSTLRWYSGKNSDYAGQYYSRGGDVLPPPPGAAAISELHPMYNEVRNDVSGEETTSLHMYLEVTTALFAGGFSLREHASLSVPLAAGEQMVGWYVPASLIPMRTVSERYDGAAGQAAGLEVKEADPIRISYTVALKDGVDTHSLPDAYKSRNRAADGKSIYFYSDQRPAGPHGTSVAAFDPNRNNPYYFFTADAPVYTFDGRDYKPAATYTPGADYYTLQEYFDQSVAGYLASRYVPVDPNITHIVTDSGSAPYVPAGESKPTRTGAVTKAANPTPTSASVTEADFDGGTQHYWLGNNGRLELRGVAGLSAEKIWQGAPLGSVWIQLYADGQPKGTPVQLSEAGGWTHVWDDVMAWGTKIDADGKVAPISCTVAEGSYVNGVFTPYSELHPLEGYSVGYYQPVWDAGDGSWDGAVIV